MTARHTEGMDTPQILKRVPELVEHVREAIAKRVDAWFEERAR